MAEELTERAVAATSTADVRPGGARDWLARDVALGRYLASAGAEVVPPASDPPAGPHIEDGLAVAFWEMVEHDGSRPPSVREAGEALRRLHALSAGADADEALDTYGRQHDDALDPCLDARRLQGALWTALVAKRHPAFRARAEDRLSRWAAAT